MDERTSHTAAPRHCAENEQQLVLSRLRSYGPAFDFELIAEGCTANPAARVAELIAQGYRVESLRTYHERNGGPRAWALLYVLRVKCAKTGVVFAAPVPLGAAPVLERWAS